MMPDGKALQVGTVHHLGDNFAKTFDIMYEDENGEQQYVYQTCYGISERCVAAPIGIHGDDRGLFLPPSIAPVQVVVVPIIFGDREPMVKAAEELCDELEAAGVRAKADTRDMRPGAKYYWWELRGVPLRIELGPRELEKGEVTLVRRKGDKKKVAMDGVSDAVKSELDAIQESTAETAGIEANEKIIDCPELADIPAAVKRGFAQVFWCGNDECARAAEKGVDATLLGERLDIVDSNGKCAVCGSPAVKRLLLARSY
jgi:prolyl-tRNA synthetase